MEQSQTSPLPSRKKRGLLIVLVVVVVVLAVAVGYLIYDRVRVGQKTRDDLKAAEEASTQAAAQATEATEAAVTTETVSATADKPAALAPGEEVPQSTQITWQAPAQITSPKLFTWESNPNDGGEAKYYKVGTVKSGEYAGGDLVLLVYQEMNDQHIRLIKTTSGKWVYLEKHSAPARAGVEGLLQPTVVYDDEYSIPELVYPDSLTATKVRQKLIRVDYVSAFFNLNGLEVAFEDPTWGTVYTSVLGQGEVRYGNGFYIKAPDSTAVVYRYEPDIVWREDQYGPARVRIDWSEGESFLDDTYDFTDAGGCGSLNFISVESQVTIADDLVLSGTDSITKDKIYTLKDLNHSYLRKMYDEEYVTLNDEPKMSYESFLAHHPIFFWVDPFNRLIKLKSSTFRPAAECGKPVVYLYPQKTTEISVKVAPSGGFTKTEPMYDDGWLVQATPESKLSDLKNGGEYPYLFWEGRSSAIYTTPKLGWSVARDGVPTFLDEKLALYGLNKKEIADFKEFWVPRMQDKPYYFVTFVGNSVMDQLAPLMVNPAPDTVIRVLMDYRGFDYPVNVQAPRVTAPARQGFTVVEWGGVIR